MKRIIYFKKNEKINLKKLFKKNNNNRNTLKLNFIWTFLGNSIYAASQWGILVVLAKLGTPDLVGKFSLGLAITSPIILFTNLGLRAVQTTDAKGEYLFGHYLGLRLVSCFLALCIIVSITWWSGYRGIMAAIILTIGLCKIIESVSDIFHGLFQRYERMDRAAISLMLKGPLSLSALSMGVWISGELLWGVVGLLLAWTMVFFLYDIPNGAWILAVQNSGPLPEAAYVSPIQNIYPRWEWRQLRSLAWLALPLGLVAMLISLNSNIPRYFIESFIGTRELGIYSAIVSLMMAGGMIINALDKAVTPRQASYYAFGNKKAYLSLLGKLLIFAYCLGMGGILTSVGCGRLLLKIIFTPEYSEYADILVMIMIAAALSFINYFLGAAMTSARYFRVQLILFAAINFALTMFCLILIPRYGLWGATLAVILAQLFQTFLSSLVVFQAIRRLS